MEAADVLNVLGSVVWEGVGGGNTRSQERPADVLLCRAQDVRVGVAGGAAVGRVGCWDCLSAGGSTFGYAKERLGAAEAYTRTKCDRAQMAERWVVLQPMIFESLGGYL